MEKYFSVCRSKIVADENVFIKNARILTETYHNIFDVTSFQNYKFSVFALNGIITIMKGALETT